MTRLNLAAALAMMAPPRRDPDALPTIEPGDLDSYADGCAVHDGLYPETLDYRTDPLRLGGLGVAGVWLFDFDANAAQNIVTLHGANIDPWVDDFLTTVWGAPAGTVPYYGRFSHFAVSVSNGVGEESSSQWFAAAADWYLELIDGTMRIRQECVGALGTHPVPQAALGTLTAEASIATGPARKTRLRHGPWRVDFETATSFVLACTATSCATTTTSFLANVNATLWLWGLLTRKRGKAVDTFDRLPMTRVAPRAR